VPKVVAKQESENDETQPDDIEEPERPRSYSLPNLTLHDQRDLDGEEGESWQFQFDRDFPKEVQHYFHAH
jgi:hypothetical protein